MHWLELPTTPQDHPLAFNHLDAAETWLASQPQASPLPMQGALLQQLEALDASKLDANERLPLLEFLRGVVAPIQEALAPRFLRKPLPMSAGDQQIFTMTHRLWTQLGIAYLRITPHFAPVDRLLPLHRAASALRLAEYCHLQAAQECPPLLDRLLLSTLAQAEQVNLQRQPIIDPEFRHLGESNIAGHVAWAFLLRLIDPYRLSAHQLAVANRAISRWRELAGFQAIPDNDSKARGISLDALFGDTIPEGLPRWLDVRTIDRKIRHRIESLQGGESPESLKLGLELSSAACIRLLNDMRLSLSERTATPATEVGELAISFGTEDAYTLLAGKPLNTQGLDEKSATIAHQRVAMFGFDRRSQLPNAVPSLNVPHECWTVVDGFAVRPAGEGQRRISPCLIATRDDKVARLGVMLGLRTTQDGSLRAQLSWYPNQISPGFIQRIVGTPGKIPVFILSSAGNTYLIAPANAGIKLDVGLTIDQPTPKHLTPSEVSERGADFVRYLCHKT
ncbi:MAG: hypothetical protein PHV02_07835 [Rhodocyclaceae bacterium]|nr:hypothetical protein [Rhodocyclaceae bacterium]